MQSFTDHGQETSLVCSECCAQFSSASSLLKHFAKHISYSKKNECRMDPTFQNINFAPSSTISFHSEKEKKTESVLQNIEQQSSAGLSKRLYLSYDSSSSTSEYCTSTSSDNDLGVMEQSGQIPQTVIDIEAKIRDSPTSSTDLKLVKCDLQKRLENCILKLSSKRDSKSDGASESRQIKLLKPDTLEEMRLKQSNDTEDFNPLKFCIVTMEEGEDKLELGATKTLSEIIEENIDTEKCSRSTSSRKQQSPKKIQHSNDKTEAMMEALEIDANERNTAPLQAKKKYPCHVCSKVFGWSTDLKRHILTHTGERPFKCLICTATFTRNFLLQKHEAKVHLSTPIHFETPSTDHPEDANEMLSTTTVDSSGESPTKRKRIIVPVQQTWNKKQIMHTLGKKLQKLQDCHSIPYSLISQTALNIS